MAVLHPVLPLSLFFPTVSRRKSAHGSGHSVISVLLSSLKDSSGLAVVWVGGGCYPAHVCYMVTGATVGGFKGVCGNGE